MRERLLRRHFIRRFMDNDLMSPGADRHEVLAALSSILIGGGLAITVLLGFKYVTMFFPSPARTAVGALTDRVFLYGCSMEVMALAALLSWNALSLDARDIEILGTLPVPRRTVVRAKLTAVAMVAAAFGAALNAVTGIVYPILLVGRLPVSLLAASGMVAMHAAVGLAAGAFGFLAVLAARELLHAALGTARFSRVSVPLHAVLTVLVCVTLLLLPGVSSRAVERWFVKPPAVQRVVPPLWFVGLHEQLMGDRLMALPHEEPTGWFAVEDRKAAALYRQARPSFPVLARLAGGGLALLALFALPAYWWNNRRFDASPAAGGSGRPALSARLTAALINGVIVRQPVARAGFWLAMRAVMRSLPHRMAMAFAASVGVAALMVGLPVAWAAHATTAIPVSALAPQLALLGALVVGFRHVVGLPANLRANWVFHVAWLGDTRHYVSGVKRFALVGLIVPAAALLAVIHAPLLGARVAGQALLGSAAAAVLLQVLFLDVGGLPLAVEHAPSGTLKTRGPVYLFASIGIVWGIAVLERAALSSPTGVLVFGGVAVVLYAGLGLIRRGRRCELGIPDAAPITPDMTLRLGLGQ